jgi:ankyrin repeat protein
MDRIDGELFEAAREKNVAEVLRLLSVGADVNATDNGTPLHFASGYHEHAQVVQVLMEHGVDTEAKDDGGLTALHWACFHGQPAVVNMLLGPNDCDGATTTVLGKRKSRGA